MRQYWSDMPRCQATRIMEEELDKEFINQRLKRRPSTARPPKGQNLATSAKQHVKMLTVEEENASDNRQHSIYESYFDGEQSPTGKRSNVHPPSSTPNVIFEKLKPASPEVTSDKRPVSTTIDNIINERLQDTIPTASESPASISPARPYSTTIENLINERLESDEEESDQHDQEYSTQKTPIFERPYSVTLDNLINERFEDDEEFEENNINPTDCRPTTENIINQAISAPIQNHAKSETLESQATSVALANQATPASETTPANLSNQAIIPLTQTPIEPNAKERPISLTLDRLIEERLNTPVSQNIPLQTIYDTKLQTATDKPGKITFPNFFTFSRSHAEIIQQPGIP